MFTFQGRLGRTRFAVAAGLRIILFAASVVGFPFILAGLVWASGCGRVGGACGAVGLVAATAFKPLATVTFVFSLLGISLRRARDAGATGWAGLAVPVLLAADHDMLTTFGAPWSLGFSMGVLGPRFPLYALLALVAVAILCILPTRSPKTDASDPLFPEPARAPVLVPPGEWTVLLALVLALAAVTVGLGRDLSAPLLPIALATGTTSILLPTFLIYLFALWAAASLIRKPGALTAMLAIASAIPFLHWGFEHLSNARHREREVAEIAALPVSKPAHVPDTIVLEASGSSDGVRAAWSVPSVERVLAKATSSGTLTQYTRPAARGRRSEPVRVDAVPPEHLLLKIGRASDLAGKGAIYAAAGGPYELRFVSGGRSELVGAWWQVFKPAPSAVPVLTSSGWYRGPNSASTDQVAAVLEAFLLRALDLPRTAAGAASGRPG